MNTDMKIDSTANELNGYSAKANQARATDENQEHKSDEEECENMGPRLPHHINANVIQMAVINKMLPKGFKFDLFEIVKRQSDMHQKKTAGLANFSVKKTEIQNEIKQQKIIQKYNLKRLREQQKLEEQKQKVIEEQKKMQMTPASLFEANRVKSLQKTFEAEDSPDKKKQAPNPKDYFHNTEQDEEDSVNIYDRYTKILESLIFHKSLVECQEVPLFLRIPTESTKNYKQIM